MSSGSVIGLASWVACAMAWSPAPEPRAVSFTTSDDVRITADFYPSTATGTELAPVVILVHMYPADRKSWRPLAPKLQAAGYAVLAYDIRGAGGSVEPAEKKLKALYDARDSRHFNDAWRDAAAARKWLGDQPNCDASRIAMIGASIGCSISLDYGRREPAVKAIICLSPGTNYMGVDSVEHIKKCGDKAMLLMSPKGEYEAVAALIEASGRKARGQRYDGGREYHGTKMFDAPFSDKVFRDITLFVANFLPVREKPQEERK